MVSRMKTLFYRTIDTLRKPRPYSPLEHGERFWSWYSDFGWKTVRKPEHQVLGEEWGCEELWKEVFESTCGPYLGEDKCVLGLGSGGGKWSRWIAPRCDRLVCADILEAMLKRTAETLREFKNVQYVKLNGYNFEGIPDRSQDLIFSYDVFLHVEPQVVFSYLLDGKRILKPGGIFILHQINFLRAGGQRHFREQFQEGRWRYGFGDLRRSGFIYYSSPEIVNVMATIAGYEVMKMDLHLPRRGLTGYDQRDILAHLRVTLD